MFSRLLKIKNSEYIILSIILVLAFGVRLYKINNPLGDWHSWRQADTASVTRSYVEDGIQLLFPRYHDISSIQTGIFNPNGYRLVEFPIYNAIHALLVKNIPLFSLEVWGRLISIFSSLISAFLIFLIGKRFLGATGGLLASFFFAFLPFNVYFSRVILPEPMAVTFALFSIWLFVRFIDSGRYIHLYLSAVFFALGMLIKPFTAFYGVPIIYLALKKYNSKDIFRNIRILLALDLALVPFFLWRIWINGYPAGIPHFEWAFNGDRIRFRPAFWRWIFGERLGRLILGIWGLIPFSVGFLQTGKNLFNHFFLLGMFFYVVIFATASVRHDYYQILIIPAISLTLAQGANFLWNNKEFNQILSRSLLVFSTILMIGIGGYQVKEYYKINHPEIIAAGEAVDRIAPKDALVIAPYTGDTAFLYQTKRWGWPVIETSLEETIKLGASFYVSVNFGDPDTKYAMENYKVVEESEKYVVVDLRERKNE